MQDSPGLDDLQPEGDYLKTPALSSSHLRSLLKDPSHVALRRLQGNLRNTSTPGLGQLIHHLFLEESQPWVPLPPEFEANRAKGSREKRDWIDAQRREGRHPISAKLHQQATRAHEALLDAPAAMELLEGSRREFSVFWVEQGRWAKARPDLLRSELLVDLKCYAGSRNEAQFLRAMSRQSLCIQPAWYRRGLAANGLSVSRFQHLLVDTETFDVRLRPLSQGEWDMGEQQITESLDKLHWLETQVALKRGDASPQEHRRPEGFFFHR